MKITDAPLLITTPFAQNGTRNDIPVTSEGIDTGRASFTTGFPDETMKPITAGGTPPKGADFNGILYALTNAVRFYGAGGHYQFNGSFAAAIGGYPMGATVQASDNMGHWLNVVEANSTGPESGLSTGWLPLADHNGTATVNVGGNTTLTPLQAAKANIRFTGSPAGNSTITFPAWTKRYSIINDCAGDQSLICTTGNGESISIKNGAKYEIGCDGKNLTVSTVNASQVFAEPNKNVSSLEAPTVQQIINALGSAAAHAASDFDPAGAAGLVYESSVQRDYSFRAGFAGGDVSKPYLEHWDGKASTIVDLARVQWVDSRFKNLGSASASSASDFDPAGSSAKVYNSSVQRDRSYRAGFVDGNIFDPYIEHSLNGVNTIVPLARSGWVTEIKNSLRSAAYETKDSFDAAGSSSAVKSYVDSNYAKRDYITRIGLYSVNKLYPFMLSENNEAIRLATYSQSVPITTGNRKGGKRVWSDGYVEQWGEFGYGDVSGVTKLTVTFPNAFTEVLSCIAVIDSAQDVYLTRIGLEAGVCSFRLKEQDSNNVGGNIAWKATGWIR